ncbi:YbdK family carboxylate-amine ligase [Kutzneria kofuensis]|uniref:Putative glutamate--cysteine ligase 2 n=1 Tax=Kutzneria kofuensis TaxID=103725 RepID=A0A7W9NM40_9PSEU|nr:YbdK family carboxylate-amine ligase [Kutzneria kofuensis]MBB5897126.1 carboxylate-amine ligase [Kutzneria kofuensis]
MSTVGVEEEFLLIDRSGTTTPRAAEVLARCAGPLPAGMRVQRELRDTQVEVATGVCSDAAELRGQLAAGRRALAAAASATDVRVLATGTPVLGSAQPEKAVDPRFGRVDELYGDIASDYEACGCHVHVGVPDKDTAVAVVNHVARWLPTLLALSVNSPFYNGQDRGYESWRIVQQSRFPGSGIAPWCADHSRWQQEVSRLVDCGVLVDEKQTFWFARPSPRWPTVEFRVADTAATVDDAVLQALLCRALVNTALAQLDRGVEALPVQTAAAAVWTASRYGMDGPAVDPVLGKQVSASVMVALLLDHVRDALVDAGELDEVHRLLRDRCTGATRQRLLAAAGLSAVVRQLSLGGNDDR